MNSVKECINDIANSKNIAIICHTAPDADALASMVALKKLIRQNLPEDIEPKTIDLFVDANEIGEINSAIVNNVEYNNQPLENYDLAISVDCASANRMGKYEEVFKNAKGTVNIDHHITNTRFADNNLVLKTSSTCEALYLLAKTRNFVISDDVCNLIYSGIITDTNNLTQGTITINTHKVLAEMLERKINIDQLNEYFFKNNSKSKIMLLQKALSRLKFYENDRVVFMNTTKMDLEMLDAEEDDAMGIVNHGINLKGVDIAIMAIRREDNSYKISLRGKNNVDVSNIAKKFGGGGHEHEAAFNYDGFIMNLEVPLLEACREELALHPVENTANTLFFGDDEFENRQENNDQDENE